MFLEASQRGKPSGCERKHSLLQKYPKECNHSLMMLGISTKYVYSSFISIITLPLESFQVCNHLITVRDDETMACVLSVHPVCAAVLRCLMKGQRGINEGRHGT